MKTLVDRMAVLIEQKASVREPDPTMSKGLTYLAPVSIVFAPKSEWITFKNNLRTFHAIFSRVPAFVPLIEGKGENRVDTHAALTQIEYMEENGTDVLFCRGDFFSSDIHNPDIEPMIKRGVVARRTGSNVVRFSVMSDGPFHFDARWSDWKEFVKIVRIGDQLVVEFDKI